MRRKTLRNAAGLVMALALLLLPLGGASAAETRSDASIQSYLETYGSSPPPLVPMDSKVYDSPPTSFFADKSAMTIRMMPSSQFTTSLNDQTAPFTWPGRAMVVWGRVDGGTGPYTYKISYGDGSPADSGAVDGGVGQKTWYIARAHTYTTAGPKTARLTVYDNAKSTSASRDVSIYVQPLTDAYTEMLVRRNAAIQDGLRYLYLQQGTDGSFPGGGYWSTGAATAAAISAFEIRGHYASNDPIQDIYAEFVRKGLEYIFSELITQAIGVEPHGDPDTNGDGVGIRDAYYAGAYEHGIIMYAIALSREPNAVAVNGGSGVAGRSYREILTNMVDQLAWSQGDSGWNEGGWRYNVSTSNDQSDNSAIQWAAIGMDAAERSQNLFEIHPPAFVRTELAIWLNYSRCSDGSYGYTGPDYNCNIAKTGCGIFGEYFVGRGASDPIIQNSIGYLDTYWCSTGNCYVYQFDGNLYALYAVKKALDDLGVSAVGSRDWYTDYVHFLVKDYSAPCGSDYYHQNVSHTTPNLEGDGYWNTDCYVVNSVIGVTSFALLILSPGISCDLYATAAASPQGACPGTSVTFDGRDSHTTCPDHEVVQWLWDYDESDGADINNPDASGSVVTKHDGYPLPEGQDADSVMATLWVVDRILDGSVPPDTATTKVRVIVSLQNHPPVACLNGPFTAQVGDTIRLDACCSYDPDGLGETGCEQDSVVAYEWDFGGDGSVDLTTATCTPDTFFVFNEETTLSIVLWVKDSHDVRSDQASASLIWSSYRDLTISSDDIQFSPEGTACDTVRVCGTVHATVAGGGAPIQGAKVHLYYDEVSPLHRICEQTLPDLGDGETGTFCCTWQLPDSVSHSLIVLVDPDQEIQESSESNNRAEKHLDVNCTCEVYCSIPENIWTYLTVAVRPDSTYASYVFRSLLPDLDVVKDDEGHSYIPRFGDELGPVSKTNGYKLFVKNAAGIFEAAGPLVTPASTPIPVAANRWNLIPYLSGSCDPMCGDDITLAMQSIEDCVDIVKDSDGRAWIPAFHINDISKMDPCKAYLIFLKDGCSDQDLVYPRCTTRAPASKAVARQAVHYQPKPTGLPEVVLVSEADPGLLTDGDEIGIFADDQLVGSAVYQGQLPLAVTVWRGDLEHGLAGFSIGSTMTASVWSRSGESGEPVFVRTADGKGTFRFEQPYLLAKLSRDENAPWTPTVPLDEQAIRVFEIRSIRPNPSKGTTTVEYAMPTGGDVQIAIYDVSGREVRVLAEGRRERGISSVVWDGRDMAGHPVSSGIYYMRLRAAGQALEKRLVMVR